MAFNATLDTRDSTATITLSGELDATAATVFRDQVEQAASRPVSCLVLMVQELEYMASAGLRVLIFAKQKMGAGVDLYMVGTQPQVLETLEKTGFSRSVILTDSYDA